MTNPGRLPVARMFIDESGTTADSDFVVARFCTTDEAAWRQRFQQAQDTERYWHTLHFKDISTNPKNGRYRVSRLIVNDLASHTDWWCHFTYVDRTLVDTAYFSGSPEIEYKKWLADLIRWRTKRADYEYHVTIAFRSILAHDDFIPTRLQAELDARHRDKDFPVVRLDTELAKNDRLLQVADLLASGTRQQYSPSHNAHKVDLALGRVPRIGVNSGAEIVLEVSTKKATVQPTLFTDQETQ